MSKSEKNKKKRAKQVKPRREEMRNMASPSNYDYDYERLQEQPSEDEGSEQRKLKVYIYASEYEKIKNWTVLYPNIETGGDLFGLWLDSHTAVVQLALGPGEKCRRYETSFFQDVNYLATAGGYLTKKHGLCNLGQWHSHHQLSLDKPSSGDENTVWTHMPTLALKRYIVCIANISKERNFSYSARVNCFLFELDEEGKQLPVLEGEFHHLKQQSPVNEDSEIMKVIAQGAEPKPENAHVCGGGGGSTTRWSKFMKFICSNTGKALIIILVLAVVFIALGSLYLFTSLDKDSKPNKAITFITGNNTSV